MVGVPAAAYIGLLLGLLAHLGDLRIALHRLEEAVHVDGRPAPREFEMLLGRELLIAEEDHAVFGEGVLDLVPLPVAQRLQIDAEDLGATAAGHLLHLNRLVCHGLTSRP